MTDVQITNGTIIIRPSGDLDVHTDPSFRNEVDKGLAQGGIQNLVVSLKNVTFIDSSGLGALLGRYRRMVELGGKMALVSIPARVKPVLELSGVLKIIPVFESEKKALEKI